MNHLSEEEIFLYCDNEMTPDRIAEVSDHLTQCETCRQVVDEIKKLSNMLGIAVKNDISMIPTPDCLNEMQISEYIDSNVSTADREIIESHLSQCGYCFAVFSEARKQLHGDKSDEKPVLMKEIAAGVVKRELRKKRFSNLMVDLDNLIRNAPSELSKSIKTMEQDIKRKLQSSLVYPCPSFAPVFGEPDTVEIVVFSPFGKVNYPITFEWQSVEEADQYEISIQELSWKITTKQTKYVINREELDLKYGEEFLWILRVIKEGKSIGEIQSYLYLLQEEEAKELCEIERILENIDSVIDKLMLWGALLEEKEFYIEAAQKYMELYELHPSPPLAYRIAACYDELNLPKLREEWNKKIPKNE